MFHHLLSPFVLLFVLSLVYIGVEFQNKKHQGILKYFIGIMIILLYTLFFFWLFVSRFFMDFFFILKDEGDNIYMFLLYLPITLIFYFTLFVYCCYRLNPTSRVIRPWLILNLLFILFGFILLFIPVFMPIFYKMTSKKYNRRKKIKM